MNIKINKSTKLDKDERILFILSDYHRKNILSSAILYGETMEIAIGDRDSIVSVLNKLQNKDWITFNGISYDLPILHKYFPHIRPTEHIDLYDLYKKNIYTNYANYKMETILTTEKKNFQLLPIEELNKLYRDQSQEKLVSAIENQLDARLELYKILKDTISSRSFSFDLGEFQFLLCIHTIQIRKDFLYIKLLSNQRVPTMEYHYDHYSIETISDRIIEIKSYVYEGIVQNGKIGKVIHSGMSEKPVNSLMKDYYPVELEGKLLLHSIEIWTKFILENI